MDSATFLLYGIVLIVYWHLLRYIITAQSILGWVLKKSAAKIIPRSEVPEYLTKFYEIKESQILNLGFTYQFCIFTETLAMKEFPQQYIFIYYNPGKKTYATLTASDAQDYWLPFRVDFETHFKNGKRLVTLNGLKHSMLASWPNAIFNDAYAETLEKQFQFHLQRLDEIAYKDDEIKEFNSEEMLKQYIQDREDYLNQLPQKGITYKMGEDKYGIKTMASLGIAHRMISGMKKMNTLRKKILAQKSGDQGMVDLPVELELADYRNSRASLTPTFKNTSGKIFLLLLLFLLFIGATLFVSIVGKSLESFKLMVIFFAALLIHDIGHLLSMRLLGFRNFKMLNIPLLIVTGRGTDKGIPPYKKAIGYFAGPIPGIVIGFLLLLKFGQNVGIPFSSQSLLLLNFAIVLLVFNYISLLPVKSLDGGQIFSSIRISQFPFLRILLYFVCIVGILILVLVTLFFFLLIYVAIFIGIALIMSNKNGNIIKSVKKELKNAGPISDADVLKKILLVLRQGPYRYYPSRKKFQLVQKIESRLDTPDRVKPSAFMAAATLIFYLFIMAAPIAYLLGPSLLNDLWLLQAVLSGSKNPWNANIMPCNEVVKYKPEQDMLSQVSQADFERLPAKKISNNSKVMRSCLFYPVNTGSTVSSDKPKAEARAPLANDNGPGIFLAKLTALYGKPDEVGNNFSYTLLEQKTGIIFQALLEEGIPVYISREKDDEKLIPLCYRFEALLEKTAPMDCNYTCKFGTSHFRIGVSGGQPFFEELSSLEDY